MTASTVRSTRRSIALHRSAAWLASLALLTAFLLPLLSANAAAAQAGSSQRECEPGFVLDEETGACEPLTIPAQVQAQPDCDPGFVLNQRSGQCEPEMPGDLQQAPPDCPEGTERDPDTGECVTPPSDEPPLVQECPAGTVLNQQTGQCEEVVAEDTPPAEPTDVPEAGVPPPEMENSVSVSAYRCPLGAPYQELGPDLADVCTEWDGNVLFTLSYEGFEDTHPTNVAGEVSWSGVPSGPITLQETIPEGYGDPYVFCRSVPEGGAAPPWTEHMPLPGGLLAWQMDEPPVQLECLWFNIPDAGLESRVVVHKYNCAEGGPESQGGDIPILDFQNTCAEQGEGIEFTLDNADGSSTKAVEGDAIIWFDVPQGPFTITESMPPGYSDSVWFCGFNHYEDGQIVPVPPELVVTAVNAYDGSIDEPGIAYCWVFNLPDEEDEEKNRLSIEKWICPEGTGYGESQDWYDTNCAEPHDGVEFTVTSDLGGQMLETAGGVAQFIELPGGTAGIQETIPDGYGAPVVFCSSDAGWQQHDAPTGYWEYEFVDDGLDGTAACTVYNVPGEPGSVTLLKWTCPPGYNLFVAGADPKADCVEATNGVQFQFGLAGIENPAELQTTGDALDGGVLFDGLEPDTYRAVELVPDGIDHVFVLECTGHIMGVLQPYPLAMGNVLEIEVAPGEHLTCHWYNVPETDGGKLTVIKYICATETFVDEVECEIFEGGATFDLLQWDGAVWQVIDTQVTDDMGTIGWPNLNPGDYWLDEQDGEWCHLASNKPAFDGASVAVKDGEETVVEVYNCDSDWTTTTIPEKYPNTGAPGTPSSDPTIASPTALYALFRAWRRGERPCAVGPRRGKTAYHRIIASGSPRLPD